VVLVTFFAPEEIVGLAYDSGGVTTNIVTVPLIAALGIGLASSIRGRNPLIDGFGLVALAVMVPMISVQLYGILVYADPGEVANGAELVAAGSDDRGALRAGHHDPRPVRHAARRAADHPGDPVLPVRGDPPPAGRAPSRWP
jgi:hypothetical protein